MERIEIYNDGDIKIEVDSRFHNYVKAIIIRTTKLSQIQHRFLLEMVLDKLEKQGVDFKGCILKASSSAPVLEHYKFLSLIEPFDIFEYALSTIVSVEDWNYLEEIVDLIKEHYKREEIPFYLEFFKKPVYNIDGFMAAKYGGELLISFFVLSDGREENIRDID